MTPADVEARLANAGLRLEGIQELLREGTFGHPPEKREQLIQEFFFHLVGAINLLAQLVNEQRRLGIEKEDVSVPQVRDALREGDPLKPLVASLYTNPRKQQMPPNSRPDNRLVYRVYNYRHQVEHRGRNYVDFSLNGPPRLRLDPRNPDLGTSAVPIDEDMQAMLDVIKRRCVNVLGQLAGP